MKRALSVLILMTLLGNLAFADTPKFGYRGEDTSSEAMARESDVILKYLKARRTVEAIEKRFPALKGKIVSKKKELELIKKQIEGTRKTLDPNREKPLTEEQRDFFKKTLVDIEAELPKIEAEVKQLSKEMEKNITEVETTESKNAFEAVQKVQTLMKQYGLDRQISDFSKELVDMNMLALILEKRLDHRVLGEYLKNKIEYVMAGDNACQTVTECDAGKEPSEKVLADKAWAR